MAGPVELSPGVFRVPTTPMDGVNSFVFLEADGTVTLVDCGLKGAPKKLVAALAVLGKQPTDVRRILLTHAHGDHAGGSAKMREHTGAPMVVHEADALYARTGKTPPKDTRLGKVLAHLPGTDWPGCPIDETFGDGDRLDVAGGLLVVHTPGHSPGHVSFLHEASGVLITGDALFNFRSRLRYSPTFFCTDVPQSRQTADRLGELDYEVAAFTHGPEMRDRAREHIRTFLSRRGGIPRQR